VTRAEIDRSAGKELRNLRQQLYRLERQKLDEYIGASLLTSEARKRGVSTPTLLEQEVQKKVQPVSDEDVQKFYDQNKSRIKDELEKIRDQIRNYLRERESPSKERVSQYPARQRITTFLKRRRFYRVDVPPTERLPRAAKAPVKIVKFGTSSARTANRAACPCGVAEKYDGKVQLLHKTCRSKLSTRKRNRRQRRRTRGAASIGITIHLSKFAEAEAG
jgi:hypothetical protein